MELVLGEAFISRQFKESIFPEESISLKNHLNGPGAPSTVPIETVLPEFTDLHVMNSLKIAGSSAEYIL
jgi:hypothetical protein